MKDFSTYTREKTTTASKGKSNGYAEFLSLASKYEGKSADEMMEAILKEAERSRRAGTLTDSDIDNFASSVAPLLNDKQRKMLGAIVEKLKRIRIG